MGTSITICKECGKELDREPTDKSAELKFMVCSACHRRIKEFWKTSGLYMEHMSLSDSEALRLLDESSAKLVEH